MEKHTDLQEIIEYLNPAELDYQDWVNVGMALKHEGYSVDVWDTWSKNDRRYHSGECEKKWNTFHGSNSPVTAGTIVQLAMEHGSLHIQHMSLAGMMRSVQKVLW